MNMKIIIKAEDFDDEIFSFLTEVGADIPIPWDIETLTLLKDAVIEAFKKKGVILEVDEQPRLPSFLLR
jgi:hypothetical protein